MDRTQFIKFDKIDLCFLHYIILGLVFWVSGDVTRMETPAELFLAQLNRVNFVISAIWLSRFLVRNPSLVNPETILFVTLWGLVIIMRPLFGTYGRFYPLYSLLYLLVVYFIFVSTKRSQLLDLLKSGLSKALACATLAAGFFTFSLTDPISGRWSLINGDANHSAVILTTVFLFYLCCFKSTFIKWLLVLLFATAIILTGSRMGIVGLTVLISYLLTWPYLKRHLTSKRALKFCKAITVFSLIFSMFGQLWISPLLARGTDSANVEIAQARDLNFIETTVVRLRNFSDASAYGRTVATRVAWDRIKSDLGVMLWGNPLYAFTDFEFGIVIHNWFFSAVMNNGLLSTLFIILVILVLISKSTIPQLAALNVFLFYGFVLSGFPIGLPLIAIGVFWNDQGITFRRVRTKHLERIKSRLGRPSSIQAGQI